jgi:hypothetical protein
MDPMPSGDPVKKGAPPQRRKDAKMRRCPALFASSRLCGELNLSEGPMPSGIRVLLEDGASGGAETRRWAVRFRAMDPMPSGDSGSTGRPLTRRRRAWFFAPGPKRSDGPHVQRGEISFVSPRRTPGSIFQRPVIMGPGFRRGDNRGCDLGICTAGLTDKKVARRAKQSLRKRLRRAGSTGCCRRRAGATGCACRPIHDVK